jgi:hypothetical protein
MRIENHGVEAGKNLLSDLPPPFRRSRSLNKPLKLIGLSA